MATHSLFDSLRNLITGMGGPKDKSAAGEFVQRLVSDVELEAMYRDDWIAKKIVKIPAYDMVRAGRVWNAEDEAVTALEAEESRLGVFQKVLKALIFARLYGGAALIIDDGGDSAKEIKPENFGKGRLKAIHAVSRRRLTISAGLESDPRSPYFGQPKAFTVNMPGASSQITVHPSRVIPVHGEQAPDTDVVEDWWGDSTLRSVYDAVQHAAKSAQGVAALIDEAKVDIVSVQNLASQLSETTAASRLINRWSLFGMNKSMNGVGLIDKDSEEHTQKQISFTDHDKIMTTFLVIVSGAADIPATRMLGQSPAGLNSTGESDLTNYYNSIEAKQKTDLSIVLDRLDAFLIPHTLGSRPEEIWYEFRSLWTPTAVQKAEIAGKYADVAAKYAGSGLVNPVALQAGVESLLIEHGTFPGFERALKKAEEAAPDEDEILPGEDEEEPDEEDEMQADAAPRSLYVHRPVKNAAEIIRWAKSQGFKKTLEASDLHVTVAFSRTPLDWMKIDQAWDSEIKIEGGARIIERLGDKGAVVLLFKSDALDWRWRHFREAGAAWDFPEYQPHITISYDAGEIDVSEIEPYQGDIVLGPERFSQVVENWEKKIKETA